MERGIFDSSPIFEISLHAALLNTLHYPYNTPEHRRRNTFLALYVFDARISNQPSKYKKGSSIASEFGDRDARVVQLLQ